jgi:hypothetical protein
MGVEMNMEEKIKKLVELQASLRDNGTAGLSVKLSAEYAADCADLIR